MVSPFRSGPDRKTGRRYALPTGAALIGTVLALCGPLLLTSLAAAQTPPPHHPGSGSPPSGTPPAHTPPAHRPPDHGRDHGHGGPHVSFGFYDPDPYYYGPPPPVYYDPPDYDAPPVYYAPPPPVYYPPPAPAPTTYGQPVGPAFIGPNGQTCQRYQTTTNGQTAASLSTACLQPDGTWRVIN